MRRTGDHGNPKTTLAGQFDDNFPVPDVVHCIEEEVVLIVFREAVTIHFTVHELTLESLASVIWMTKQIRFMCCPS